MIYKLIQELSGVAKFGIALEWGSRGRWFNPVTRTMIAEHYR